MGLAKNMSHPHTNFYKNSTTNINLIGEFNGFDSSKV